MDPYTVLGLQRGASEEDVKQAFRRLAKTCHPDLNPGNPAAEQRFKEINAAYDAIRNPQPEPTVQAPSFDDFPFPGFEDMFAHLRGFSRPQRNNDIHLECRLTLEEAFYGKEFDITVPQTHRVLKMRIPPGVEDGTTLRMGGAGDYTLKAMRPGDLFLMVRLLPHATWTRFGRNLLTTVPVTAFDVLLGKDIEVVGIDGKQMRIGIPSGFDTSRKLRLAGQGMMDANGRGDLLIELFIIFDPLNDEQRSLIEQAVSSRTGG